MNEYGYGLWTKFMMTSPERIQVKPENIQLIRFSSHSNYGDMENPGDRVLATFIGRGVYHFATYSEDISNTYKNVNYRDQLDGCWNYIYFSYSKSIQKATAWVYFGGDQSNQR